jgi:hypothetical protein
MLQSRTSGSGAIDGAKDGAFSVIGAGVIGAVVAGSNSSDAIGPFLPGGAPVGGALEAKPFETAAAVPGRPQR